MEVKIEKAAAILTQSDILTCGMVGKTLTMTFSQDWDGLILTAVFRAGNETRDVVPEGSGRTKTAVIPHEVLKTPERTVFMGVWGGDETGSVVLPTVWCALGVVQFGAELAGAGSAEPTPGQWEWMRGRLETLEESKARASHLEDEENPHHVTAVQTGAVPTSRTVNGKALSGDISLTAADVGAAAAAWTLLGSWTNGGSLSITFSNYKEILFVCDTKNNNFYSTSMTLLLPYPAIAKTASSSDGYGYFGSQGGETSYSSVYHFRVKISTTKVSAYDVIYGSSTPTFKIYCYGR